MKFTLFFGCYMILKALYPNLSFSSNFWFVSIISILVASDGLGLIKFIEKSVDKGDSNNDK